VSERLTILVIVGTSTDEHSLRSQVGMGSESDCLLGQFERTLWISDSQLPLYSIVLHDTLNDIIYMDFTSNWRLEMKKRD